MVVRSSRRTGNEIARALISMMARSPRSNQRPDTLMQDRSPLTRRNLLATHGRTIHWVKLRRTQPEHMSSALPSFATLELTSR